MTDSVWRVRMAKALAIVVGFVLCVPTIDALGILDEEAAAQPANVGLDARAIIGDGNMDGFIERVQKVVTPASADLPSAFAREVGLPFGYRDLRVDSSGTIVSCVMDSMPDAAADVVGKRMAEAGWREVTLGSVEGATYVKDSGSCAWVLVTCTQVGDATTVVYRCVYR